jgi:predicted DCC family thiol-disulfide oxidoreductase YuxK
MAPDSHELTVYYDGSCALCRAEIGHYRKQDGADAICFRDVSDETVALEPDITRQQVMQRFHVRHADGSLTSGAEAFTGIWRMLPRWRWASRVAALPGMLPVLEFGYRAFLPIRPKIARVFNAYRGVKPDKLKG